MNSDFANRANVAALIPAYREENHIFDVAKRVLAQLDHVLILDDGSPDATAEKARDAGAEVISHEVNRGKGAAIKTGLRVLSERGFQYIQILDGDGQHLPGEIPRFLEEANRSRSHIILGNRMSDTEKMPFVRKLTNQFMSWQISRVCRQYIPDTQCGFRAIHRDVAPLLFCETDAFDYETEMLLIASRAGFKISSVPVSTVYGEEKSKIHPVRDTIKFFRLMARYRNS
jgi:glycosyltransferase involved in cell wall biosynthesis